MHVTQTAVKALIASESSEESAIQNVTFNLEEVYPNSRFATEPFSHCVAAWRIKSGDIS